MGWPLDNRGDYEARSNDALLFVKEGDVSKLLPPGPVHGVCEAGVVRVQLGSVGENLICEPVQVLNLAGEPGHGLRVVQDVPRDYLEVAGLVLNNLQSSLNVTHS